jgi:amidase
MRSAEIEQLMTAWDGFRTTLLAFMEHYDVILCPVSDGPAMIQQTLETIQFSYDVPYSLTGYPCAVVRVGTAPGGLPLGVQVVARPWREDVALATAGQIETALGGWQRPPL